MWILRIISSAATSNMIPALLQMSDQIKYEILHIPELFVVDQAATVRLVTKTRIVFSAYFHQACDLAVTQAGNRIIDTSTVKPQPVVIRFAVGQNPEIITVHGTSRPFLQP